MKCYHLKIHGIVQGVSYRISTLNFIKKNNLDIKGEVKNLADGCVQIIAYGNDDDLHTFLTWCENGPPLAKVSKIEKSESNHPCHYLDFKIIY